MLLIEAVEVVWCVLLCLGEGELRERGEGRGVLFWQCMWLDTYINDSARQVKYTLAVTTAIEYLS